MGIGPFESYEGPGVFPKTVIAQDQAANTRGMRIPVIIGTASEEIEIDDFNLFRGSSAVLDNPIYTDDLALQITGTNRNFNLSYFPVVTGDGTGTVTDDPTKVTVLLNDEKVVVVSLDGATGEIWLASLPQPGDTLVATYYYNRTDTLKTNEDLSDQVTGSATTFKTKFKPIVTGNNGGVTTTDVTKVTVTVNGVPTTPTSLDGTDGLFTLATAPVALSTVLITYYTNTWQNTWDLLPESVARVLRVGNYPGKTDYYDQVDFVTNGDRIYWGSTAYVEEDENHTQSGSTPFDGSFISLTQYDNFRYSVVLGIGDATSKTFYLPDVPMDGSGLDVPTDDPSLVTVRVGTDIEAALLTAPVLVTTVDSTTRALTLAAAPALGRVVIASFYYSSMRDDIYSATVTHVGTPVSVPKGEYSLFDSSLHQMRDANEDPALHVVAAAGFGIEGITWPGGLSDLQTIQGYSPVETIRCTFQNQKRYVVTSSRSTADMAADGLDRTGNAQTGVPGDAVAASAIAGSGASMLTFTAVSIGDWGNNYIVRLIDPAAPGAALTAARNGQYLDARLATSAAVAATGTLISIAFNLGAGTIQEGDYFVLSNGVNAYTFEFDSDGSVLPGRLPVTLLGPSAANLVHAAIILAINTVAGFGIVAGGASPNMTLTGPLTLAANVPISENMTGAATLTPVGMAGGTAGGVITTTAAVLAATFAGTPAIVALVGTAAGGAGVVAAGTFQLAGGNPRCGYLDQTYVDPDTGVRFTILSPTIFNYAAVDYLVFKSTDEFYVKTSPTRSVPGLKTVVATTVGNTIGNVAFIKTFDKAGSEPAIGDEYYISFTYPKTDFSLRIHSRLADVQAEFGEYSLDNPLVVAFGICQRNGSPYVGLMQVQKEPNSNEASDASYIAALSELEKAQRGNPNLKAFVAMKCSDAVQAELKKHCEKMSSQRYRRNRRAIIGTEVGTDSADVKTLARALKTDRLTVVYCDKWIIGITDSLGTEVEYLVNGAYLAAAYAGLCVSPQFDVAESMINKQVVGLKRPSRILSTQDMNDIAPAGVTLIEWLDPILQVRHDLTTDMSNILTQQETIPKIYDYIEEGAEDSLQQFVGQKGLSSKLADMQAAYASFLRTCKNNDIIKAYKNPIAEFDSVDPRIVRVYAEYSAVLPIVWVPVTNSIRVS